MKIMRLCFLLVVSFCLVSCASMGLQSRMQRVSPGMPKAEVVKTLGNGYEVVHSMLTPEGETVEIFKYMDALTGDMYEVEFVNGRLVRYTKVYDRPERPHHNHRH